MTRTSRSLERLARLAAPLVAAAACSAQPCQVRWDTAFSGGGLGGIGYALASFDDGGGPALFAGGEFFSAGSVQSGTAARWRGRWSALGAGTFNTGINRVFALAAHDDGSGPALYLGGNCWAAGCSNGFLNAVAKWDGVMLRPVGDGLSGSVAALAVFDDDGPGPSPPSLYAAGQLTPLGGGPGGRLVKWDGASWTALPVLIGETIRSMAVVDLGQGPALYIAGSFTGVGTLTANRIARWDGSAWSSLGAGLNEQVLSVFGGDDGSGMKVYAGGLFTAAGGLPASRIAAWNGTSWSAIGTGLPATVECLAMYDDGGGPALYAGGHFAGGVSKWNGQTWAVAGGGIDGWPEALAVHDDGDGPALYATGQFTSAGGRPMERIASWDGQDWTPLSSSVESDVRAIASRTAPTAEVIVGGDFRTAGTHAANRIARFSQEQWAAMGDGFNGPVRALAYFDRGQGEEIYAGGEFTASGATTVNRIARWDGSAWTPLGDGVSGPVHSLAVYDDGTGPALFVGGEFSAAGGSPAQNIARWNGASWSRLGSLFNGTNGAVHGLAVYGPGSPRLYVGGSFTIVGGLIGAGRVAAWDGTNWSAVGGGMDGTVNALEVFTNAGGTFLYAGGAFASAGGSAASCMARWDGTAWTALGSGIAGGAAPQVLCLAGFNDGRGPSLYAGGAFGTAGGSISQSIARWNGTEWVGGGPTSGVSGEVLAMAAHEDPAQPALYVGGDFDFVAFSTPAVNMARLLRCPCYANCDASTTTPVLNVNDFQCFLNLFAAADPRANCDRSTSPPVLNINDFTCFLNAFATGCP